MSPGSAFVADGVELSGPLAARLRTAPVTPAEVLTWSADRREIAVPRSAARVLVVPESINPAWQARTPDGAALTPVTVNGWQQGWVLPAGAQGTVTLHFPANTAYRTSLVTGLALLPLLALLAWWPGRRRPDHRRGAPVGAAGGGGDQSLGVGVLLGGAAGAAVFGTALAVRLLLRNREDVGPDHPGRRADRADLPRGHLLSRQPALGGGLPGPLPGGCNCRRSSPSGCLQRLREWRCRCRAGP